jgi:putative flippase GtrA
LICSESLKTILIKKIHSNFKSLDQLTKFSAVGITGNLLGYLIYILLTYLGLKPTYAVSILYPMGAMFSFYGNLGFTFKYTGNPNTAKVKFIFSHLAGYLINIIILHIFVTKLTYPHELIQLFAICIVAIYLFFISKFFIFKDIVK